MIHHAAAPFLAEALGTADPLPRTMPVADQVALLWILSNLRPAVAIEIGVMKGGSLQVLARYARKVYALDIRPDVAEVAARFPNAVAIEGDSAMTLPALLRRLSQTDAPDGPLGFILVDGAHDTQAVGADLAAILTHVVPRTRLVLLLHDDAIPATREAIQAAPWMENPFVYSLDFDLTPGIVCEDEVRGDLGGGFAMAVLGPAPRRGELAVTYHAPLTQRCLVTGRDVLRG